MSLVSKIVHVCMHNKYLWICVHVCDLYVEGYRQIKFWETNPEYKVNSQGGCAVKKTTRGLGSPLFCIHRWMLCLASKKTRVISILLPLSSSLQLFGYREANMSANAARDAETVPSRKPAHQALSATIRLPFRLLPQNKDVS